MQFQLQFWCKNEAKGQRVNSTFSTLEELDKFMTRISQRRLQRIARSRFNCKSGMNCMQAGLYARKMNKSIANSGASNALHIVEIGRLNSGLNITLHSISKKYTNILIQNSWMRDSRCKHETRVCR